MISVKGEQMGKTKKHSETWISITPKEGVGRSNRLGDANKIKGLQLSAVGPFCLNYFLSNICDF